MSSNPSSNGCSDHEFGPTSCERFDFTLLFEQSILSTLPAALFLLLIPMRLYWLYRSSYKVLPHSIRNAKAVATLVHLAFQLALVITWSLGTYSHARTDISMAATAISLVDSILIVILSFLEHQRSYRPSSLLLVYLLISSLFDAVQLRTLWLINIPLLSIIMGVALASKLILFLLEAQTKASYLKEPYSGLSPESQGSIISLSFFWWLNRLFITGFGKVMAYGDLFTIHEKLDSRALENSMERAWEKRKKPESRYALPIATSYCLVSEWLLTVLPRIALIGFNYAQPFLITRAIGLLNGPDSPESVQYGYGLIGATFLIYVGKAIATVHYRQRVCRVITMFRGAMVTLIYNRTLYLQDGLELESAALTLMSTDVENIVESLEPINEIWGSAIEICIGVWLLQRQLGTNCVVPIILTFVCTLGQAFVAKYIGEKRQLWTQVIQERVATTASALSSMKAIKMMGFERLLRNTLQSLRIHELSISGGFMWLIVALNVLASLPAIWSPAIVFISFTIQAKIQNTDLLSTGQAFTSLAIISLLTKPAESFMVAIPHASACMTCFTRIQDYLLLPSIDDCREMIPNISASVNKNVIAFTDATICPTSDSQPALSKISLSIAKSSLVFIIGPVGSGKTTLLKAILGELPCKSGLVSVASKSMSYCHQTPWLQNQSILQSISGLLVDQAIDEAWYQAVVHACCLDADISLLPEGSHSIIGNNGHTLSGGQKQRLALARAVYARKDILLLDDGFSALDAKTEETVFNRLLGNEGLLSKTGTTVVLTTHSLKHLPFADKIVVFKDRHISHEGPYEAIRSKVPSLDIVISQSPHNVEKTIEPPLKLSDKTEQPIGLASEAEANATRRIGDTDVYRYYAKSIGWKYIATFIAANIGYAFSIAFPGAWLVLWMRAGGDQVQLYLPVYVILGLAADAFLIGNMWVTFVKILQKSSARLHIGLLDTVMGAPQSFFAQTDTGITLNKFSQDMSLIDNQLPIALNEAASEFCSCIAQAALIFVGSSYMAITAPFAVSIVYLIQNVYLKTSRQLRYMDLEAKSPIYSHFLETLEGLTTIRAFGWQRSARETNLRRLDSSQKPYYLLLCAQRWLNLVLDLLVAAIATIVVSLAFTLRHTSSPGLLGVALNTVLVFNQTLSKLIAAWTSLETSLGAIARVKAFSETAPVESKAEENIIPPSQWPQKGEIVFECVSASYDGKTSILSDLTVRISPGEKIGVCGRTGSGKSSLILTLLRLVEMTGGKITIDGVDLSTIPRHVVRSRVITIPQDRFMLAGSIRLNADPSGTASDESIRDALEKVHLWSLIERRGGLNSVMEENSLSSGQHQLFRLARAILRKDGRKILILDEATSNVDTATDSIMQQAIEDEFKGFTIITVAHRLDTIINSDRIAVLDHGKIIEFDSPKSLQATQGSVFNALYNAAAHSQ